MPRSTILAAPLSIMFLNWYIEGVSSLVLQYKYTKGLHTYKIFFYLNKKKYLSCVKPLMMKTILTLFLMSLLVVGCTKETATSSTGKQIKYELVSSVQVDATALPPISYTNNSGALETVTTYSMTTLWSKEVTLSGKTPSLQLMWDNVWLTRPGTVTATIYVNGVKEKTTTSQSANVSGFNIVAGGTLTHQLN